MDDYNKKIIPDVYHDMINQHMKITDKIYLMFFAIETSGLPKPSSHFTQLESFERSRILKISWKIFDNKGNICKKFNSYVLHKKLPKGSFDFVDFDSRILTKYGKEITDIMKIFYSDLCLVQSLIAHNLDFHLNILRSELYRHNLGDVLTKINEKNLICSMSSTKKWCKLEFPNAKTDDFKPPRLTELYEKCFNKKINKPNCSEDVTSILSDCYFYLKKKYHNKT